MPIRMLRSIKKNKIKLREWIKKNRHGLKLKLNNKKKKSDPL